MRNTRNKIKRIAYVTGFKLFNDRQLLSNYFAFVAAADPKCLNVPIDERNGLGDIYPNKCLADGHCYDTDVSDTNLRCFDRSKTLRAELDFLLLDETIASRAVM